MIARVALSLLVAAGALLAAPRARAQCAIEGVVPGIEISIRQERGIRRVRLERPTRIAWSPMRTGIAGVRVLEGDPIEGTTRLVPAIVVARAISLREATIELPRGLPIERVRVAPEGPWAEIDVVLGDGARLLRAPVPCDALALAGEDAAIAALDAIAGAGPAWRARTTRLALFDRPDGDRSMRLEIAPAASARFLEIERHTPWVLVGIRTSLGVRMRGWVRDWDLVR